MNPTQIALKTNNGYILIQDADYDRYEYDILNNKYEVVEGGMCDTLAELLINIGLQIKSDDIEIVDFDEINEEKYEVEQMRIKKLKNGFK